MAILNGTDVGFVDMKSNAGGNTTRHMLRDTQARDEINILKSAATALENLTDYETRTKLTFYDGEIHSGTPQADARRCYSELIDNAYGREIFFDDTKYKALLVFFSSDESQHTYNTWASTSPVTSTTTAASYPKLRVELTTKDDSAISKTAAAETTYLLNAIQNKNICVRYVATSGSDANNGTKDKPFATVNKALESGAGIIYLAGGRYFQQIDLAKAQKGIVDLRKSDNANVFFSPVADRRIVTSETLVTGRTKTYQATIAVNIDANNRWLYQEGINDASTAIIEGERLPQQRGLAYRCANTLIKKCASSTVSDAIAEIEASAEYLWYLDGTTLYFSRPYAVSGSNPISYSDGSTLFVNNSRDVSVKMEGIICEFMGINLDYTVGSIIRDCSAGYVFGSGAITYDFAQAAQIIRCEALRCNNGNQGDGINGHADTSTGGLKTRRTTAVIIDCWSHDNRDDGFSDHQGCESTIIGGLFEHNAKGGVTPSYGAHCTAYSVISRDNYNGFYYTGQSSDEGVGGQLECFACIAENNNGGSSQVNAGFVIDSTGNMMTLIGCKSNSNKIGYYAPAGTQMRLYDCTALDCAQVTFGKARMTIKNGVLVAP